MIDHDEVAAQTPVRIALSALRQTCALLRASRPEALATALQQVKVAKDMVGLGLSPAFDIAEH